MKLSRESILLILICSIDLVFTLYLLRTGAAHEGNFVMAFYLNYGVGTRQYRPRFVRSMMRGAIAAYIGIYLALFVSINLSPPFVPNYSYGGEAGPSVQNRAR